MLKEYQNLIENNPLSIATLMANGLPNLTVVAAAKVVAENQILVTDNFMNQAKTDVLNNENVCVGVFNAEWEGIKMIGRAAYFESVEWLKKVKEIPENAGLPAKDAVVVTVEKVIELH